MMKHALVFGCAVSLSEISPSGECEVEVLHQEDCGPPYND